MMDIDQVLMDFEPEIQRLSHSRSQRVPDMDPEDVANEMRLCLWKAVETHSNDDVPIGAWWWKIWTNRRTNLRRYHYWPKRLVLPSLVQADDVDVPYYDRHLPDPPTKDPVEVMVWNMLAVGGTSGDVMAEARLSKRSYYKIIRSWRTDDVRDTLREA